MVNYNPKSWFSLIFHSYSRAIIKSLFPAMVLISIYTLGVSLAFYYLEIEFISTTAVHSILGIVLGFFLVFRTNSAYDRWWEGRKAWGTLVNNSRNLALKFNAIIPNNEPNYIRLKELLVSYPFALKDHLRDNLPNDQFSMEFSHLNLKQTKHIPNAIALALYQEVNKLKKSNVIDAEQYRVLDNELVALTDVTGICERIKNTPIPYSYIMFMKKFIFVFMITLPFAFVDLFGFYTVGIVVLLLYILLSIELLAEEIEDPFGTDENDLPTDVLAVKIKANIEEIMN